MMADQGTYRMARGWMKHPIFMGQPLSRREAWCWLIEHAVFRPTKVDIKGRLVDLNRGQMAYSIRYLAEAWGWDKAAVSRLVARLKTETMIETHTETGMTVITICNYDVYQDRPRPTETATETATETEVRQQRDSSETNKKSTLGGGVDTQSTNTESESTLREPSSSGPPGDPIPEPTPEQPGTDSQSDALDDDPFATIAPDPDRPLHRDEALRANLGPDYGKANNRRARWMQKVLEYAQSRLSSDAYKKLLVDVMDEVPDAMQQLEVFDRQRRKSEKQRAYA